MNYLKINYMRRMSKVLLLVAVSVLFPALSRAQYRSGAAPADSTVVLTLDDGEYEAKGELAEDVTAILLASDNALEV